MKLANRHEFVKTVADAFYINEDEFNKIRAFILYDFDRLIDSEQLLIIEDLPKETEMLYNHMTVSGLEGRIMVYNLESTSMFVMRYIGEDELYMNGQLIQSDDVYVLSFGSSIRGSRIKPIFYSDIAGVFYSTSQKEKILFEVDNVSYKFPSGKRIHSINFQQSNGHLVGIMGASGAGKTTLLNILNGTSKPTTGTGKINGFDIYSESENIKGLIGYVSQDDLLIEELTVFQNLYLNARLCFKGMSPVKLMRKVLSTLQELGLFEIKDMVVGSPLHKKISGGQRKRLNIIELIREPVLVFPEPQVAYHQRFRKYSSFKDLTLKGHLILLLFISLHQIFSKMLDYLLLMLVDT